MSTRIYLLRHAESANPNVFHGAESDVGLSDRGRRQAEAVAAVLAGLAPHGLVTSPMLRARLTAAPIAAACGLSARIEPELYERRLGPLAGLPFHAADAVWPEMLRRWAAGDTGFAPEGAESFAAVRARLLPVWERLTSEFSGRRLVIVAHGAVCKVLLLSILRGFGPGDWERLGPIRNAAVTELTSAADGWEAVRLNDVPEPLRLL